MFWEVDDARGRVMGDAYHWGGGRAMRVGSLGKVVVALGIMHLVAQRKLRLDAPVASILPELKLDNPWEATDPVRVVHLLEHSSGLDDMHFNEYYRYDKPQSLEEALLRNAHSKRIRWRPGTCSAYSNVGYAIAARIIERVTHQPFDAWLKTEVLLPLGMRETYFERGCDGYDPPCDAPLPGKIGKYEVAHDPYLYAPAVGLVSTGSDLARLMRFFIGFGSLDGQRLLDSATVARMFQHSTTPAHLPQWYQGARGIGFNLWGPASDPAVRASGFVEGYVAQMCFVPGQGAGWLMLSNATANDAAYIAEIAAQLDRALPQQRWLPVPDSLALAQADNEPLAGHYRFVSRRNALFGFYDDLYGGIDLGERAAGAANSHTAQPWSDDASQDMLTIVGNSYQAWAAAEGMIAQAGRSQDGRDFLLVGERYYEFDPSPWPRVLRLAFAAYQVVAWAGLLLLLATIVGRLRRQDFARAALPMAILANLPYWCGFWGLYILRADLVFDLGRMSAISVGLMLLSILLPLASLAAWVAWWRAQRQTIGKIWPRVWRWMHLPLMLGNLGLAAYLSAYGLLPFFSWLY
jgi:CubicO group peptidase (beta-lactamase class C family)